jgi:hypothetical protein
VTTIEHLVFTEPQANYQEYAGDFTWQENGESFTAKFYVVCPAPANDNDSIVKDARIDAYNLQYAHEFELLERTHPGADIRYRDLCPSPFF